MTTTTTNPKLKDWLFQPFHHLAGWPSFALGLGILLLTGITGYFGEIRFDGVLDAHLASGTMTDHLLEQAVNWLSLSLVLALLGLLAKPGFRFIDLLGTQAIARGPMLLAALFCLFTPISGITAKVMDFIQWKLLGEGEAVAFATSELALLAAFAILSLLCIIWMVYLMYHAFSTVCHLKGGKAIALFIAGLLLGEVLSKVILYLTP